MTQEEVIKAIDPIMKKALFEIQKLVKNGYDGSLLNDGALAFNRMLFNQDTRVAGDPGALTYGKLTVTIGPGSILDSLA